MKKIFNYTITCNLDNFYLSIKESDYFIYKTDKDIIIAGENEDYTKCMNVIFNCNEVNTDNPIEKEYDGYIEIYKTVIYDGDMPECQINLLKNTIKEKIQSIFNYYTYSDIMEMKKFIEKYEKEILKK